MACLKVFWYTNTNQTEIYYNKFNGYANKDSESPFTLPTKKN